jgi:hypothetical protein
VRAASSQPDAVNVPDGVDLVAATFVLAKRPGTRTMFLCAQPDGIADVVAALRRTGGGHVVLLSSSTVALV